MAVAASLNRNPRSWLVAKVLRHDCSGTAQERERACQHALVANGDQFGHAGAIGGGEDGDHIAIGGPVQIRVLFPRCLLAQTRAMLVTLSKRTGSRLNHRRTRICAKYAKD